MIVAFTGSRRRSDTALIRQCLSILPGSCLILHGGAPGIDTEVNTVCLASGLAVETVRPDRAGISSRFAAVKAYHARNLQLVERADIVLAFPAPDRKGGTENTIEHAVRLGKPCFIYEAANTTQNALQLAALTQAVRV